MPPREAIRQRYVADDPIAYGSLARFKVKKAIAEAATQQYVDDAVTAHAADSDPHTQYVTHDPAIAAAR